MSEKIKLGQYGENIAARYLRWRLYRVVARNYRTPFGELDLVCRRGRTLVFVEVKTRSSEKFGPPELAITPTKSLHLVRAAEHYRRVENVYDRPWRIDVVAVLLMDGRRTIKHFENAVQDWEG